MWEHLFARTNYTIGETYNMKGNVMNSDDKLECLRLAIGLTIETAKNDSFSDAKNVLEKAKHFYAWVSETDKPNSLTFEKINPERK